VTTTEKAADPVTAYKARVLLWQENSRPPGSSARLIAGSTRMIEGGRMQNQEREVDLLGRVYLEYLELPGLQLTVAQSVRLWNTDRDTCIQALETLVDASFLRRDGDCYVRVDAGRMCA
jgi:hypothetical protein